MVRKKEASTASGKKRIESVEMGLTKNKKTRTNRETIRQAIQELEREMKVSREPSF